MGVAVSYLLLLVNCFGLLFVDQLDSLIGLTNLPFKWGILYELVFLPIQHKETALGLFPKGKIHIEISA
jgi:hypothetical protein